MSKYTTEVRYICERAAGLDESKGFADVDDIIETAIPNIFNFDFPVFDDNYKSVICTKILRHYYTREIGFETVGLWKLKLETKLCEVMPYFNQLYESELIKFNPLYDTDLRTTNVADKNSKTDRQESKTGISSGSSARTESGSNSTINDVVESNNSAGTSQADNTGSTVENGRNGNTHYDLYSDTPQGGLTGVDAETYLTNARKITDNATADTTRATADNQRNRYEDQNDKTSTSKTTYDNSGSVSNTDNRNNVENMIGSDNFNSTESYVLHVMGKQGGSTYSTMLKEFRETFLNIDMDVIESLNDLFLNLW